MNIYTNTEHVCIYMTWHTSTYMHRYNRAHMQDRRQQDVHPHTHTRVHTCPLPAHKCASPCSSSPICLCCPPRCSVQGPAWPSNQPGPFSLLSSSISHVAGLSHPTQRGSSSFLTLLVYSLLSGRMVCTLFPGLKLAALCHSWGPSTPPAPDLELPV